ncbi:divalent-cation tolerance protein CutA [Maricaulis sp. CAU 1757]
MTSHRLLYSTWPDEAAAHAAAHTLVERRLCACVNIMKGVTSVYRWQDGVQQAQECVAIFKTTTDQARSLRDEIVRLHPYDEPAVVALPVEAEASAASFLAWISQATEAVR